MIYDYVKTDEMMMKLKVDPIQFHLLFLLYHKTDGNATTAQIERFKHEVLLRESKDTFRKRIDDLVERGLVDNWNDEGAYGVDKLNTTPFFESLFIAENSGEELWNAYPATFPLSTGEKFLARIGDKDAIMLKYERKIRKDVSKHKFVLEQLQKFIAMANSGKINGCKIQTFVDSEMWEILSEMSGNETVLSNHGSDF